MGRRRSRRKGKARGFGGWIGRSRRQPKVKDHMQEEHKLARLELARVRAERGGSGLIFSKIDYRRGVLRATRLVNGKREYRRISFESLRQRDW